MGTFKIDTTSEPGILHLTLEGSFDIAEMREFVKQHNAAIDAYRGREYRVFCDISKMRPLSQLCAAIMEKAKTYSASRENFRGSAVLVASTIVAMQHRRTSEQGGVLGTELISDNVEELREHLRTVNRAKT